MIDSRVVTIDRYVPGGSNFTTTIWDDLPSIRYKFVLSDKGDASWEVPLSHTMLVPPTAPSAALDRFSPISHDYRIGLNPSGVGWETVHEGIIGPVGMKSDEQLISVQGFDYLWWLEQPYHFSGYSVAQTTWTAADVVKTWVNQSQQQIITDLVANLYTTNLQSVNILPVFEGSGWGEVLVDFKIIGETTNVLDMVKAIAELNDPYGYEFTMDVNPVSPPNPFLSMWSPKRTIGTPSPALIAGNFTPSTGDLIDIDWTNNGPKAITTVGLPPFGVAFVGYDTYTASKNTYRDWLQVTQFKDAFHFLSQALVDSATASVGFLDRNPQKELTITIRPEEASINSTTNTPNLDPLFWFRNQCGFYVYVDSQDWFMPYHRIQSYFVVISQELINDNAGNWTCKLQLQQVYS